MTVFAVGDRVVRNPATWQPNDFDSWGRGIGVGVVVDPPFPLGPDEADVRWPGEVRGVARCAEAQRPAAGVGGVRAGVVRTNGFTTGEVGNNFQTVMVSAKLGPSDPRLPNTVPFRPA
jgi:hypothetical protein